VRGTAVSDYHLSNRFDDPDQRVVAPLVLPPLFTTAVYLHATVQVAIGTGLLWLVGRDWMELPFFAAWEIRGGLLDGLGQVWFIFAWAVVSTLAAAMIARRRGLWLAAPARTILGRGVWASVNAGVFEEIIFRWLAFLSAMVVLRFLNWVTFGLLEWLYTAVLVPVANWLTFGALDAQLYGPWVLAAAIISTNAHFRDGHQYLGFVGWVNAWFIGMVMFWLMFNYGLLTAIAAHIVYDVGIVVVLAIVGPRAARATFPGPWGTYR
jgi:hypothetical protein